ncbi:MAG: hypothetical protein AAF430_18235 [Myxococcota bacterium]
MRAIVLSIAIILVSGPSLAVFGVNPGDSCDAVITVEAKRGSAFVGSFPGPDEGASPQLVFEGLLFGAAALHYYTCEAGSIRSQMVTFDRQAREAARVTFQTVERELTADLGPPNKDLGEAERLQTSELFDERVERFLIWDLSGRLVTLSWIGSDAPGWEVLVTGP